jgi:hypothetical protein
MLKASLKAFALEDFLILLFDKRAILSSTPTWSMGGLPAIIVLKSVIIIESDAAK